MAVLKEALCDLLRNGIPNRSSLIATASREAAEGLLEWVCMESNRDYSESFTTDVVEALDKAFPPVRSAQMQAQMQATREKMWEAYHCIRTSQTFTCL